MKKIKVAGILITLLLTLVPVNIFALEEPEVIRIGYTKENPFIKNSNGIWQGFGVEYLERVADYNNWKYRFILIDDNNVEKALAEHSIDLAFVISERVSTYDSLIQSEFFIAYENTVIYAKEDEEYYYNDYESLEGKVIGTLKDSKHTQNLLEELEEMEVECSLEYFTNHEKMYQAMEEGMVDVVCHGSLYHGEDIRVVARFNVAEYYCFTGQGNERIIRQWDRAMEQLKFDEPNYEGTLYDEFFGHSIVADEPMFTREEAEYIASAEPIVVKLMAGSVPLSYINEDGEENGIFVDFLRLLEEKSGLTFDIQIETNPEIVLELTKNIHNEDYILLRAKSAIENETDRERMAISIPLVDNHLSYIRRRDDMTDMGRMNYVFALTREMSYLENLLMFYSEDFTINYYESSKSCLDAVVSGMADIAIQDAYIMNYLLQRPVYTENLVECPGEDWVNGMCVIAGSHQQILIDIINKSINHITIKEKDAIPQMEVLLNPYRLTFSDLMYKYHDMVTLIVVLLVVTMIIYTILIRFITKTRIEMRDYENLQKKIQQDELTGLYNRPYFYRRSREQIQSSKEQMCIVLTNIVNFQIVNDLYSMDRGDKVLTEIADWLRGLTEGKKCILSRFTGDRFYMCLSVKDFYSMSFPRQFSSNLVDLDIKLNYGVYMVGEHKELAISIMCGRAAIAAHNKERNEVEFIRYYSEDEHNKILEEQQIESEMKPALKGGQFCVYIQPKYDVMKECIIGGEALVRWKHPEKGMIPPFKFINIFEKNGFIVALDYYVWEETCRLISLWKREGIYKGPISVNVSRAHFYSREMQDKLLELISKYQITPKDLQLEITETICSEDHGIIYGKIQELRDCGFAVAMDDFGSGYSSLNMLKEIPLDIIKMDLKFLDGNGDQTKSRYILESLIRLARNMNLEVVVEGVETAEQVEFLKGIGNVYAQGYYYSKPIESDVYAEMLTQ